MKANEINLNRFLSQPDTQFVIPVYQRNYDWTTAQCKQLLDDILMAGLSDKISAHFIGSIVYIHDDVYTATGIRELTVIDGQQRLTTITLLYLCVYRLLLQVGDASQVTRIHETYLINKFASEAEKLKLRPTENNDRALRHLLEEDAPETYTGGFSRVIANYSYFRSRVTPENRICVLKGLAKLMFVEISLERGKDDAQRIFESLNSTGLELSQADLIRNYVLMGLSRAKQDEVYRKYWEQIEALAKDEATNTSRVSDFIRDFLTLRNKRIPNKDQVYLEFKEKYRDLPFGDLEALLTEIRELARHYQKLLNPGKEADDAIRQQLEYIRQLEIVVCYPFLLQVYDDHAKGIIDRKAFLDVLELIQSFAWRRFIVGLPTNALNKIFMRLYEEVDVESYLESVQRALVAKKGTQRFPKDGEVLLALAERDVYNIKPKNRLYLLERLENHMNHEHVRVEGNADITIEHIFPQNPDPRWKSEMSEEEYRKFSDTLLHTLGNLTLSGNNGSLGNRTFVEKLRMNTDGKEQGYAFSRLWLNRYLADQTTWGKAHYDERSAQLGARFLAVWTYADVALDESGRFEEQNLFDADDPTGKSLEYATFDDTRVEVHTVTELYAFVLRTLFQRNPDAFFATELREKLKVTRDRGECRAPVNLNDIYFIESHGSSQMKFERLKLALSVFDMEDTLMIKYAP